MAIDLDGFGVFVYQSVSPQQARDIEELGYRAVWVAGSPPAELAFVEPALQATRSLVISTAVLNIWSSPASAAAASFHRIERAFPDRLLLGIGAGHHERTSEYIKPYDAMTGYLDALDAAGVPADRRLIAAQGPRMLALAGERAAGAHPALVTPEHTATARATLGPGPILAPHHLVVLDHDRDAAMAAGREALAHYLTLANYLNNWKRLGFTEADLTPPGSDRLCDALIASGPPDAVANRLREHVAAGADHVALQVVAEPTRMIATLAELADALGLKG